MKKVFKKPPVVLLSREYMDKLKVDQKKLDREQEEILVRLQAAREMGDLSENGAYRYAKFELGNVRRQLGRVNYLLRWGRVEEKKQPGVAGFGSKIKLKSGSREIGFVLVSEHEADPKNSKLSMLSPYGVAVMGARAGEKIVVKAPAGDVEYQVVEVE